MRCPCWKGNKGCYGIAIGELRPVCFAIGEDGFREVGCVAVVPDIASLTQVVESYEGEGDCQS